MPRRKWLADKLERLRHAIDKKSSGKVESERVLSDRLNSSELSIKPTAELKGSVKTNDSVEEDHLLSDRVVQDIRLRLRLIFIPELDTVNTTVQQKPIINRDAG